MLVSTIRYSISYSYLSIVPSIEIKVKVSHILLNRFISAQGTSEAELPYCNSN